MRVNVRGARPEYGDRITVLGDEFVAYLRALGDPHPTAFEPRTFRQDGFGPNAAFSGLVAEVDGTVEGYLLYHPGYDIDRGGRVLCLADLYVREAVRGRGVGRALMTVAARIAHAAGAGGLVWSVYARNTSARAFYERLGARHTPEVRSMYWSPEAAGL